ncbi:hypothetical protein M9Y10_022105 [Tritrichomonas musculus]|uniref:Uncharacterized protein n=1 Tax=Tritrichomonas musculus TaxID=1915356 RepID=A0ABR2KRB6_9EUKA
MITKRSTLHLLIKEFRNLKCLGAKETLIRLTELNDKQTTKDTHISRSGRRSFISIPTFTGQYNGIILSLRYRTPDKKKYLLGEIIIPFDLIPFKQSVKFVITIPPPNANLIPKVEYPVLTFLIFDQPFSPGDSIDLTHTKHPIMEPECVVHDQPFENPPVPVDQSKKTDKKAKDNFTKIAISYKKNKDVWFEDRHFKALPDVNIEDPNSINKKFESLFTFENDIERINTADDAVVSIQLMKENQIVNIEGLITNEVPNIPIGQMPDSHLSKKLTYYFDFNYA